MKQAPAHVVAQMKAIDPKLRIRWSLEKRVFIVDRKVERRYQYLLPKPVLHRKGAYGEIKEIHLPEDSERYITYHDCVMTVMSVKESALPFLPELLRRTDCHHLSVRDNLRKMDEEERRKEMLEDKRDSDEIKDIAGEAYDSLHWRQGERMAV